MRSKETLQGVAKLMLGKLGIREEDYGKAEPFFWQLIYKCMGVKGGMSENAFFTIKKNPYDVVKCPVCKGRIKEGLPVVVCMTCGSVSHEPCMERANKCGACGQER